MDTDNGDYLAPTNSELLALNNTNKPSIFGLLSQLAKNVEKKNTPGKFRVVTNPTNWIKLDSISVAGHFRRLASISSIDEGDFGHGKKTPLCNSVFQLGRIWVKTNESEKTAFCDIFVGFWLRQRYFDHQTPADPNFEIVDRLHLGIEQRLADHWPLFPWWWPYNTLSIWEFWGWIPCWGNRKNTKI